MQVGAHMHYRTLSTCTMCVSPKAQHSSFCDVAANQTISSAGISNTLALCLCRRPLNPFMFMLAMLAHSAVVLIDLSLRFGYGGIVHVAEVLL